MGNFASEDRLAWFYFYTPDYAFWHQTLATSLSNDFHVYPIPIENFNLNEKQGHHFKGVPIKIGLVISAIQSNLGKSIIFSDCTWSINKNNLTTFQNLVSSLDKKYDFVFADNHNGQEVNIGLILIHCNDRTLAFWQSIRDEFLPDCWDQQMVNQKLGLYESAILGWNTRLHLQSLKHNSDAPISWTCFPKELVHCTYDFNESFRSSFALFKAFIRPRDTVHNWNSRLMAVHRLGLITQRELNDNLKPVRFARILRVARILRLARSL